MSVLTVTTLFPNAAMPQHGAFVAARLDKLLDSRSVQAEVIAPVPWIPPLVRYAPAGRLDLVPRLTARNGTKIWHPRYLVVPKIGMTLTPRTLYGAFRRTLERLLAAGRRYDLIDAHYFYPDGVAAVRLAREFAIPVVVTARGTDVSLIPDFAGPRRMILDAAAKADGLVTVCQALKDRLVELGVAAERVTVLRNGVDLDLFKPIDREQARKGLGLTRTTLLSVGWLIPRKGHDHVIRALRLLPDTDLLIAGTGPEHAYLEMLAKHSGVADRVRFLGTLSATELAKVYGAADALVLASSREGWANVLLESMACGTPVVASAVWGTPEVVAEPAAGMLIPRIDAEAIAAAVRKLLEAGHDRAATRRYAERFSWDATTKGQLDLFRSVVSRRRSRASSADADPPPLGQL
ncbi:MAG: glycosyltransferase family 4 protein [Alphaproteobacteria bacterium]|nr:glycosyltransferase family 4 protein [Alphaproteobacteria bacterium]